MNRYTLQICRAQHQYQLLSSFWAGIVTEAVIGRLALAQSGRKEVQRQRQEDVLLKVLPVLNHGFSISGCSDLTIACYALSIILAKRGEPADNVLDGLMKAVASTISPENERQALICLSILADQKADTKVPKKVVQGLRRMLNCATLLEEIGREYRVDRLIAGAIRTSIKTWKKKDADKKIDFIEKLFQVRFLDDAARRDALSTILRWIQDANDTDQGEISFRRLMIDMLERLSDIDAFAQTLRKAASTTGADLALLEMNMQTVIECQPLVEDQSDVVVSQALKPKQHSSALEELFSRLPDRTVNECSFLCQARSHIFEQLEEVFLLAVAEKKDLSHFRHLPIWQSSSGAAVPLFISFLVRIACGPYSSSARSAALIVIREHIVAQETELDTQALIPYIVVKLADRSQIVRREASNLVHAIYRRLPKSLVEGEDCPRWGSSGLYGKNSSDKDLRWLPSREVPRIVAHVFVPILEECVLDAAQIGRALHSALLGSSSKVRVGTKKESIDLKKYLRLHLFELLTTHISATTLYSVKSGLLQLLFGVNRVGTTSRSKELLPTLQRWVSLSSQEVERIVSSEQLLLSELESAMVSILTPEDKHPLSTILALLGGMRPSRRPVLVEALFTHAKDMWPSLKLDRQISAAETLLEMALDRSVAVRELSRHARDVLFSVKLHTDVLMLVLEKAQASFPKMGGHPPSAKRRRTSNNQAIAMESADSMELETHVSRATFVVELVDGAKPGSRPQLLSGLFHMLAALHSVKAMSQRDLPYLLSLLLGSMLDILHAAKTTPETTLDTSTIRADLIIDCIRMNGSPQVQNTALLVLASLSSIAPELVLHSVMPVFTFMSASVFQKDDEYSSNVIDQTLDQVIPPLIKSLREQKRDVVMGTSELLLSFAAAFEHIPTYRRVRLFESLISKLGAKDFLYAVLAILANRYGTGHHIESFLTSVVNAFDVNTQLITFQKYVDLAADVLRPQPVQARVLLGLEGSEAQDDALVALSQSLATTLRKGNLKSKLTQSYQSVDVLSMENRTHFSQLLEHVLNLAWACKNNVSTGPAVRDCLDALLAVLSLDEYIAVATELLNREDNELRRSVLGLLEARLSQDRQRDPSTQLAAMEFIPKLCRVITHQHDVLLKHAAVACLDRIAENYGRKDITSVLTAARVVASEFSLGAEDSHLRIMALLCLASYFEILKDAIIPLLPEMMPRAFHLLEISLIEDREDGELHNAAFSFLSAMLSTLPFMVSDTYLDAIFALSSESANSDLESTCHDSRREALQLLAKHIDLVKTVSATQRTWSSSVENGLDAVKERLEFLSVSIEHQSKSTVIRTADLLSDFLLQALDLRRVQLNTRTEDSYADVEVSQCEAAIHALAIKIIYKLNDTAFRPIFTSLVEWAVKGPDVQKELLVKAQILRQTTLFNFLQHFFSTLRSIVTSYASYVLDPAIDILKHTASLAPSLARTTKVKTSSPLDSDSLALWTSTLAMLRSSYTHDADSFFASPSNFEPLASTLISQLNLSHFSSLNLQVMTTVIPTVVALATAVLDNPAHHKTLNHHICELRKSESAAVRMASVKTQQALTDSEEVGEEWLNNVMQGGEGLVYVNEMLEDDDEEVEYEVRRWVGKVRDVLGEDVLEG